MTSITNMAVVFGLIGIIMLFVLALAVVSYILSALSYFTVAKRRGIAAPWLAWIPITQAWTLGSICDHYDGLHGFERKWRKVLISLSIIVVGSAILAEIVSYAQMLRLALSDQRGYSYDDWEIIGMLGWIYGAGIITIIVASAMSVCQAICMFKFYESCRPQDAVKYLLLSLLVPLASPFCLMSCRKFDLGLPQQPSVTETQLPPPDEPWE